MKVWFRKNMLHMDNEAYDLFLSHARRSHKTVKQIVHAAIRRGIKRAKRLELLRLESKLK